MARILVTGFEPFPGAPVNPTEWLVARLRADPPVHEAITAFRAEVLPVDYARVGDRLAEIGRAFDPHVAIHFGLARESKGFRLERLAVNSFARARPDNDGLVPEPGPICVGPAEFPSKLPLDGLHARLSGMGLPVEWSDDAGGYLCNMVMTLSLAHACPEFKPSVSGFVHVPLTGEGQPLDDARLLAGARAVIDECLRAWRPPA